jgi:hypothetical protein
MSADPVANRGSGWHLGDARTGALRPGARPRHKEEVRQETGLTGAMYEGIADPYCYAGTTVLKNLPGLRKQSALDRFETIATAKRAEEPLPAGVFVGRDPLSPSQSANQSEWNAPFGWCLVGTSS